MAEAGIKVDGVSVIICCYNSRERLYETLRHLSKQQVPGNISWEIIIVDNASTDGTAGYAISTWKAFNANTTLRVVEEKLPGQMHARIKGALSAAYEVLVFCDDDNWLCSVYVHYAYKALQENSTAGAAGGRNLPVSNIDQYPEWFEEYKDKYATGIPAPHSGDITHRGFILGAGMVTRCSLFLEMFDPKYPSLLNGRNGEKLSTGDDFEYCKRLMLRGYKLYYEERLELQHFIPKERITVEYRDRLMEGIYQAGEALNEYDLALRVYNKNKQKNRLRLLLLTPFRIFLAKRGLTERELIDEQLTFLYLAPFPVGNNPVRNKIKLFMHNNSSPTYRIYSFYRSNVNPKVPKYQRKVFERLGYKITHIVNEEYLHGDFLNHICRTVTDVDFLIFFDIDCIPVQKDWLPRLMDDLKEPHTIAGAAQTANHLRDGKNLYVSPFFCGISTSYLKELNYPDMNIIGDMDSGQNLTEVIRQKGGNIKYWWPTDIEEVEWTLYHPEHTKFGPGTTYDNRIYHAFLSRFDLSDRFLRKCKTVLKENSLFKKWFGTK